MATEAHKFEVGIFVIIATAIGIGAVVWLGASRFFQETQHFVTYFSESVQGLDPGSSVKYRGVPAGRVDTISIARPGRNLTGFFLDLPDLGGMRCSNRFRVITWIFASSLL